MVRKHYYRSSENGNHAIECTWDGKGNEIDDIEVVYNLINGNAVKYTREQLDAKKEPIYFVMPKLNDVTR